MAAGLLEPLVLFWKEWGILVLVLMSFAMQVTLLITAEIRRRKDSGVLKEHQLMAFWAPFLLMHLGGQDNITAYSIEDNRLWLRHLQSLVIQVVATAYVIYDSSILAQQTLLRPIAILMFVVSVVKYGESVCALKLASSSNLSGKNYKRTHKYNIPYSQYIPEQYSETYRAHALLQFTKDLLKAAFRCGLYLDIMPDLKEMYRVAEMQLSLMHDILYSKAELIYTWHGCCIRVFSLSATVAALLLFLFREKGGYGRADVAATYVLLAGAVILEITSVLRAVFSSWTYYKFIMRSLGSRHYCVARAVAHLALIPLRFRSYALAKYAKCRGGIRPTTRYWSGSMGQHNFIYMWSHYRNSRGSKIARWIGWEDSWNILVYTSSVPISTYISELLEKQMKESQDVDTESPDHIQNSRGRVVLKRRPGFYEELAWSVDTELDESIILWHIATHVYLRWYEAENSDQPHHLAQVMQELSNYMMFLLAARPHMLPDNANRQSYIRLCNRVINHHNIAYIDVRYTSEADLCSLIRKRGDKLSRGQEPQSDGYSDKFDRGCELCAKLIRKELETPDANMMELITQVWVDLLCYVACRCGPDSHARQLSNGGELTTIVALMLVYLKPKPTFTNSMADSTTAPGNEHMQQGGAMV